MTPDSLHDFFVASVSVAGGLIGLLFVAISVAPERMAEEAEQQINRVRAQAAMTAFLNALAVGLFALIPDQQIGYVTVVVAMIGLLFVAGSSLSLVRMRRAQSIKLHDGLFLLTLFAVFVGQLITGVTVTVHPHHGGPVHTIALLVVGCFLIGIDRTWELIGGPSIGFRTELSAIVRRPATRSSEVQTPPDHPNPPPDG